MKEAKGGIVHVIPLSHAEYSEEIGMKLLEEANEVYFLQKLMKKW